MSNLGEAASIYEPLAGIAAISTEELLGLVLNFSPEKTLAFMETVGGLEGLKDSNIQELKKARGVGPSKALRLRAAMELGIRLAQAEPLKRLSLMASTDDVVRYFSPRLSPLTHEELHVVSVDCRNRAMKIELVARGGLVGLSVHPREIIAPVLRIAAAGFILVHNHPSGDPTPSMADRELTQRVRSAGEIIGIPLLDHVVVARGGALSV